YHERRVRGDKAHADIWLDPTLHFLQGVDSPHGVRDDGERVAAVGDSHPPSVGKVRIDIFVVGVGGQRNVEITPAVYGLRKFERFADEGDAPVLQMECAWVFIHGLNHVLERFAALFRLADIGVACDELVYFAEGKQGFEVVKVGIEGVFNALAVVGIAHAERDWVIHCFSPISACAGNSRGVTAALNIPEKLDSVLFIFRGQVIANLYMGAREWSNCSAASLSGPAAGDRRRPTGAGPDQRPDPSSHGPTEKEV